MKYEHSIDWFSLVRNYIRPANKMRSMKRKIVPEIISFLLIVLFVYAAVSKMIEFKKFSVQIGKSPLLTDVAPFVAWFIPTIEIVASLLVAFPRTRLMGLYVSFTLMVMFTAYIVAILNFTDDVPCSCGGVLEALGWTEHLIFNIVFIVLSVAAITLSSRKRPSLRTTRLTN